MKVSIKDFTVAMEVKNKGIALDIYDNENYLGDLTITKTRITWCNGKTPGKNGKNIEWKDFIVYMNSRP